MFPSGYQANLGMVTALSLIEGVEFYVDRLCHASILDGLILSRGRFKRYAHNDIESLEGLLNKSNAEVKVSYLLSLCLAWEVRFVLLQKYQI